MHADFIWLLELKGFSAETAKDALVFGPHRIPVRDGIPRFSPDKSYSEGNFELLRERHACLQLDSVNGTSDRHDTILTRTGWPEDFWKDKLVLECGTGAGADTECLLKWGAKAVSVDLAGSDIARRNLGDNPNLCLLQADITDLPLRAGVFDVVFCHRVLQHTPDPEWTLAHILSFLKPTGHAFVHSYARTFYQMFRWKYGLRPITTRMKSETLYKTIEVFAPVLYRVSDLLNKTLLGRYLCYVLIPFHNYRHREVYRHCSDAWILEYGIHDTFDALSPRYDRPISAKGMTRMASERLCQDFEVVRRRGLTLLRTKVAN